MRRRDVLKLITSGGTVATTAGVAAYLSHSARSNPSSMMAVDLHVDWATVVAHSTPLLFGSNDYEITDPKAAADLAYQKHLADLDIRLIRIHHAGLCDRWTNSRTQTWDEAKIKAGYDASYPQRPILIQNIPGWPNWMAQNPDGLLAPRDYDRYASFCAELVEILNQRQQRNIRYWEPLNEKDVAYEKAGKLDELWKIYNSAAIAMKAKDDQIKIGGPVLTWDEPNRLSSFLRTCGSHVDFISWHGYASGDAKESTDKLMVSTPSYGQQVQRLRAVLARELPQRKIPLFLSEYNINYTWDSGENRQNTHIGAVWFASVLKHLAEAGIEMAASWHLKDGIYGLIDNDNKLRPAATVFAWGVKYLVGKVMLTTSNHPLVEALAVWQEQDDRRSLLLINKSSKPASLKLRIVPTAAQIDSLSASLVYLREEGIQQVERSFNSLEQEALLLAPYSLALLLITQAKA
ncbi:hypothetical protein AB3R30_12530 [Leptolyngbyaceae cyanobacterium UHCC 1019]